MPPRSHTSDEEQARAAGADAAAATVTVPTDQAVPTPEADALAAEAARAAGRPDGPPPPPDHPSPIQPTPPAAPAAAAARRAAFKGQPNEYLSPLLIAERNEATGEVIERIYYTPARDLTDDEWNAMPEQHREYVSKSSLYDVATTREVRAAKRAAAE